MTLHAIKSLLGTSGKRFATLLRYCVTEKEHRL